MTIASTHEEIFVLLPERQQQIKAHFIEGLKLHIENALGYRATIGEVLEVMEIASLIGMQTLQVGAPLLRGVTDELRSS